MLLNNIKAKNPARQIVAMDWRRRLAVVDVPAGGIAALHFDPTTLQDQLEPGQGCDVRCNLLGSCEGDTMKSYAFTALASVMVLSACAQVPMGSTVPVMPGPNTSLTSFQNDQFTCRQFAQQAVADQAQGANLRGLGTAALTTALGAGLGGAIGGGRGAGIGAASGALGGAGLAAVGSSNAQQSIQAQFDNAFAACMFSLGNTVPGMSPR